MHDPESYTPNVEVPAETDTMWAIRAIARNAQRDGTLTHAGVVADCAAWEVPIGDVDPAGLRTVLRDLTGTIAGHVGEDVCTIAQYLLDDVAAAVGGDGPTTQDYFPVDGRVIVHHMFDGREVARGTIVGYRDGYVDTGTPESGPGPVHEAELIVVLHDYPAERVCKAYDPSQLETIDEDDEGRYGVTNASTHGFAWRTDDRAAADRCARRIAGTVVDTQAQAEVGR